MSELKECVAWARNLAILQSGALGDPKHPDTLLCYWRMQERAGYPYAKEKVQYFSAICGREIEGSSEG